MTAELIKPTTPDRASKLTRMERASAILMTLYWNTLLTQGNREIDIIADVQIVKHKRCFLPLGGRDVPDSQVCKIVLNVIDSFRGSGWVVDYDKEDIEAVGFPARIKFSRVKTN